MHKGRACPIGYQTLHKNNEFRRIYAKGKSKVSPLLVIYAMKNREGMPRVAVVSSKKIGKAVQRNRARRVVRAALRECGIAISGGWDIVFVCRVKTTLVKSTALLPVLRSQLPALLGNSAQETG